MAKSKRIHFVGVGGVGTGTLAAALAEAGHQLSGSDGKLYEPMKSVLSRSKVRLFEGFEASRVDEVDADYVVIGNVIRKDNAEAQAWIKKGTPYLSFPQAVREFLIEDRVSVVCAGTHGKTTTTSWVSFLLQKLSMDPSYLIGGVPCDLPSGCRLAKGQVFVGEGDEYDSAFFDKGPKFLHYNPTILILSSIEFDHADIYRDLAHVQSSFDKLMALMPGDGLCIARHEDPVVAEVTADAICDVQTFGRDSEATWRIGEVKENEDGFEFEVLHRGKSHGYFKTPLYGDHNLYNLLSGIAVASHLGHSMDAIRPWTEVFHGARRRQEVLIESPVRLIDDFAHHPTEVNATLSGVRRRFPDAKIWAFFEPRSATSRRNVHQDGFSKCFGAADNVLIAQPIRQDELPADQRFDLDGLIHQLTESGKSAAGYKQTTDMVAAFARDAAPGDIAVVMSNGEFDKIQEKLRNAIAQMK